MNIVKLNENEIVEIKSLWEQLNHLHEDLSDNFKHHYAQFTFEERMKRIYKKDSYAVFVAKRDEKVVGYSIASIENNSGEIDSIYIIPDYRNNGLGKKLIKASEAWLTECNVEKIVIGVAAGNEVAFPFYQKQGYLPRLTIFEKV